MVEKKGSRKQGSARDDEATHFFSALSRVFLRDFLPIQAVQHRPALAFCASTLVRIHTIAAIPGPCHMPCRQSFISHATSTQTLQRNRTGQKTGLPGGERVAVVAHGAQKSHTSIVSSDLLSAPAPLSPAHRKIPREHDETRGT